ncbi:hypothetical protein BKA58DRAFT_159032 [Alternaria rosae]|uniref:uncharacterized protein n=1 Tax=Alternaria rosae TaxID=1187941 RepID=UPI001E8CE35A|nr:uncharacterized protein BKA58DRAFT_159032 [Alternaria rosae]KAH6873029.1 hypothetical protein BKA58DRAFT_159032 [Alternaria rosae]
MTNPSIFPDPDPQRYHRVLQHLANVRAHGFSQAPVLTPALQFFDEDASRWLPSHAPAQPQSTAAPEQGNHYPQAIPLQRLTLEGLNNDVLAIVMDFICEAQTSEVKRRKDGCGVPKTRFDYRREGSSLFCLSLVSKRMRATAIPILFTHVFRDASSMGDLNRRLRDMEGNPLVPSLPLALPAIKPVTLSSLRKAKTHSAEPALPKPFPRWSLSLSFPSPIERSILRLRILSHGSWSFLVEACPNVETLALEYDLDQDDAMLAAGALENIKRSELCCDTWRKRDVQRLQQYLPDIQSPALRGSVDQEKLTSFAETFGLFKADRNRGYYHTTSHGRRSRRPIFRRWVRNLGCLWGNAGGS